MLSIEPVVAGPIWGCRLAAILFRSLMALIVGGSVGETEPPTCCGAGCAGRADKGKTEYRHDQGQAAPALARNFIIPILLLSCVVGNFYLVPLLSGIRLIPSSVRSETCVIHRIRPGFTFRARAFTRAFDKFDASQRQLSILEDNDSLNERRAPSRMMTSDL